jgi:pimeloyl-ACP methyl ester carboxylesterase
MGGTRPRKTGRKSRSGESSRNSKLIRDPKSGHSIHRDNPALVADAISEVVLAVSSGRPLAK